MEELIVGKTVIGKKLMKDGESVVEVDVIYAGEESGFLMPANGVPRRVPNDKYQEILREYRLKQSKSEAVDRLINDEEEVPEEETQEQKPEEAELPEKVEKKPLVQTGSSQLAVKEDKKKEEKLDKKKLFIPVIILVAAVLVTVILLAVSLLTRGNKPPVEEKTYHVAVLKNPVTIGDAVKLEDFEDTYVSRETYEMLSRTTYIGANGRSHEGTVILWQYVNDYEGCIALRSLDAGTVAMADDFSLTRSAISGQMTIRLVAVIGSDSLEDNIVCELGRYVVEAGSLEDILNAQNQSVLGTLYSEAQTEATVENIAQDVPETMPPEEAVTEEAPAAEEEPAPAEEETKEAENGE